MPRKLTRIVFPFPSDFLSGILCYPVFQSWEEFAAKNVTLLARRRKELYHEELR